MGDLFDVLGISTREDSYTSLLAALFEEKPQWAREFFMRSMETDSLPPEPVRSYRWPVTTVSGKKVVPDLVLAFGCPISHIWVIEAKIESQEGKDQLIRQESDEARRGLIAELELPEHACWYYSYSTLEGVESANPAAPQKFRAMSFEPLTNIFSEQTSLPKEIRPAYTALRKRLQDYYGARSEKPNPGSQLSEYLEDTGGLISRRARFYWLCRRISESLGLKCTFGVAQSTGNASPFCQMRETREPSWQGSRYLEASDATPLKDCYDIHLEAQLDSDRVRFLLHYESNPYIARLEKCMGQQGNKSQYEEYRERRRRFAEALNESKEELGKFGWKLTLSRNNVNQLARLEPAFALETTTVGSFQERLRTSTSAMREAIEIARRDAVE